MSRHHATTLLESLVVISIMTVLFAILFPAVQMVRDVAVRSTCQNNLRQIITAAHTDHEIRGSFPPASRRPRPGDLHFELSWIARLLPHCEQSALWDRIEKDFRRNPIPGAHPRHETIGHVLPFLACPADPDSRTVHRFETFERVALTSYLGNMGRNSRSHDGVIYWNSSVRIAEIMDGTSHTLFAGERPASPEKRFGWWYIGYGQDGTGSLDFAMGTQEENRVAERWYRQCGPGPFPYRFSDPMSYCSTFQFWSDHRGGANFAFCDGSIRFLRYGSDSIMKAIGTRSGGETISTND
jgi:prepilin-type processing-associated H-X9-DG protein